MQEDALAVQQLSHEHQPLRVYASHLVNADFLADKAIMLLQFVPLDLWHLAMLAVLTSGVAVSCTATWACRKRIFTPLPANSRLIRRLIPHGGNG